MQSTETEQNARLELEAMAQDLIMVHEGRAILCRIYETPDKTPNATVEVMTSLLTALAAERDRADRAEARLAEAWDEGVDATFYDPDSRGNISWGYNPYRSEATA